MPILPTKRDLGPLPRGPSTATAQAADTSAVGRGLQGLGQNITAGMAVIDAAWKDAKKAEEESKYLQFEWAELGRYKDAVRDTPVDEMPGFSARWNQESTARWRDELSTYSEANRAGFGNRAFESVQTQIHSEGGALATERTNSGLVIDKSIADTSANVWSPQADSAASLETLAESEAALNEVLGRSREFINGLNISESAKFQKINELDIELKKRFGLSLSVADMLTLDPDHPRNNPDPEEPDDMITGYAHMMTGVPYDDVMTMVSGARSAAKTKNRFATDQAKQLQGAVANGAAVTEEHEQFMQSYFPSLPDDERIIAERNWEYSKRLGGISQDISDASGGKLDDMEAAVRAEDTNVLTSEVDKETRRTILAKIEAARTLREDDPFAAAAESSPEVRAAYVKYIDALSGEPVVEGDWEDDKPRPATQAEIARFGDEAFSLSREEQIRLGTPDTDTRVIGNDKRQEIIEELRKTVRDESGIGVRAKIEQLKTLYGRHWFPLFKDIVTKGPKNSRETLPSELTVAASMILNAPGQALLYDLIDAKAEGADPLDNLDEGIKSEIIAAVGAAMVELNDTLPSDASGEHAKKAYKAGIALLAAGYYADTKTVSEAVGMAYADVSTNKWHFFDTYRVPKVHNGREIDVGKVSSGVADLRFFLESPLTDIANPLDVPAISRKFNSVVLPPPTREGQSELHIREMYLDHMKNFGEWITSPNEDGVILRSQQRSSLSSEMGSGTDLSYRDRDGVIRPIVFTWDDLESLYEQRLTTLGPYPSEIPPDPETGQQQYAPPLTPTIRRQAEETARAVEERRNR